MRLASTLDSKRTVLEAENADHSIIDESDTERIDKVST